MLYEKTEIRILHVQIYSDPFEKCLREEQNKRSKETRKRRLETDQEEVPWLGSYQKSSHTGPVGKYLTGSPVHSRIVPSDASLSSRHLNLDRLPKPKTL